MANQQTSPVSIPSCALARMALVLACNRIYDFTPAIGAAVLERQDRATRPGSCSFEYYLIIDRISRGEQP